LPNEFLEPTLLFLIALGDIMAMSSGDDEGQRDAMAFHQQMALASFFFPGPSDSDQPPPVPKALWSWRYQYFAMTRIYLPFHCIPPTRLAIWPETLQPVPRGESKHESNWNYQIALWEEPSIDSRCGEHKQYLQILCDNQAAFCRYLFSGYKICSGPWLVAVREAPHASKKHQKQPMTATLACAPPLNGFMGMHAILFDKCQVIYG
jgi:hypothetical protein